MTKTQQRWPLTGYELLIAREEISFAFRDWRSRRTAIAREVEDAIWTMLEARGMKGRYRPFAESAVSRLVAEVASHASQEIIDAEPQWDAQQAKFDAWIARLEATPPEQRDIRADVQARRWEQL